MGPSLDAQRKFPWWRAEAQTWRFTQTWSTWRGGGRKKGLLGKTNDLYKSPDLGTERLPVPVQQWEEGADAGQSILYPTPLGSIPGWGRSPGEGHGYPLQYPGLENSTDRGAWQATQPMGLQRVRQGWVANTLATFSTPSSQSTDQPLYMQALHSENKFLI